MISSYSVSPFLRAVLSDEKVGEDGRFHVFLPDTDILQFNLFIYALFNGKCLQGSPLNLLCSHPVSNNFYDNDLLDESKRMRVLTI